MALVNKRAYSQLERADDGLIKVVFYDVETSLPVEDLTGYEIVALDETGQAIPANSAPVNPSNVQPAAIAELPPVARVQTPSDNQELLPRVSRENKGSNDYVDTGPLIGGLGALSPSKMLGEALGNENVDGNKGWRNKALTTALSVGAGALVGGPIGAAVGFGLKSVVNSDKFKNAVNDTGSLSPLGVGPGLPKAPTGVPTVDTGFGVTPTSRPSPQATSAQPTQIDATKVNPSLQSNPSMDAFNRREPTQSIGTQETNIPNSSPINYTGETNELGVPSREIGPTQPNVRAGSFGRISDFDRTGLTPGISRVADKVNEAVPGAGINSGYRSAEHNAKVGGAKASQHVGGNAIDIDTRGWTNEQKRDALEAAVTAGAKGVGIYNSGNVIHTDTRTTPTSWGPKGYAGSGLESMPEWSRDTLSAMYGAGVGGNVGPRIGPTPKSRESVLNTEKIASSPIAPAKDDLAFASRPNFSKMTPGQVATSGFGKKPSDEQVDAMAYTLAGELDPSVLSDPKAIANLAATINNRVESVGVKSTFTPSQYNSLDPKNRQVTEANYSKYGPAIKDAIKGMYEGTNVPEKPDATHYYNPSLVSPSWGSKLSGTKLEGNHRIGNIPGEYEITREAAKEVKEKADNKFTEKALESQAGRNVENTDKNMSGDKRTSFSGPKSSLSNAKSMSTKSKDDKADSSSDGKSGVGSKSKSSSSSSNKSSGSKKSGSSAEKSGDGFGSNRGSTSSSSKTSSKSSSKSSSSSSGGFANSKSMSTRSKDDSDSKSSKSSSSKSSSSSGGKSSGGGKGKK